MIIRQQQLLFSEYSELYDLVVSKDNLLRKIKDKVDFSFVIGELEEKYSMGMGRGSNVLLLFKLTILKTIFELSDVAVINRAVTDLSFKYFLDLRPEETEIVHPTTLCKFRTQKIRDSKLLDGLIQKSVEMAIVAGVLKSKVVYVDSTHTIARSTPISAIKLLEARAKRVRRAIYTFREDLKGKVPRPKCTSNLGDMLEYAEELVAYCRGDEYLLALEAIIEPIRLLEETIQEVRDNFEVSRMETDARVGHKSPNTSFYGFKTHLAVSDEGIVTGAVVTSGEKADGDYLEELVKQTKENGVEVETVVGDAAYSGTKNLELAEKENVELISKLHPILMNIKEERDDFTYNKDSGMMICPAGHEATRKRFQDNTNRKRKQGSRKNQGNDRTYFFFDIDKCKVCSKREGCYKEGAKQKSYSITHRSKIQSEHLEFQESEVFREKYKKRYKVEGKNGDLKNNYGLRRAKSYGLGAMSLQATLAIFASNIKRIIKLEDAENIK